MKLDSTPRLVTRALACTSKLCAVALSVGALTPSELTAQARPSSAEARRASWRQHVQMRDESPLRKLRWRAAGPVFQGGRIETIAWHDEEPRTLYVGAGSGGVFKSTDAGRSWRPIFDQESTSSIGSIAIAKTRPKTVWVGTGEVHPSGTSFVGSGIFRSTDGGESWRNMGLHDSHHIARVLVHPEDASTVYAALMGHHRSPNTERGVYRTKDAGETWERVLFIDEHTAAVDLVMHAEDPKTLFASTWSRRGSGGSGVHKSSDGGETWTKLRKGLPDSRDMGRVSVDVGAEDGRIYALVVNRKLARGRRPGGAELYCSEDGGASFERTHEAPLETWIGWDFCDVRVAPEDSQSVYLCGQRLLVSHDGGASFRRAGEELRRLHPQKTKAFHLDMHDVVLDPRKPGRLLIGSDGGLFESKDYAQSWLHLNTLPIGEFYTLHLDDLKPYWIWGGTQDNASLIGPSSASLDAIGLGEAAAGDPWRHLFLDRWGGGDGFASFPDPHDRKYFYYEHQNGDMRRKRLNGPLLVGRGDRRIRPRAKFGASRLDFAWNTPLFASVHGKRALYCAAQRVFKSTNHGLTWKAISSDLSRAGILSLSESPIDAGVIYAACPNGSVHVTRDDGASWTRVSKGLPRGATPRVLASRHGKGVAYVVADYDGRDDFRPFVFRTRDYGASWTPLAQGLPLESVYALAEDPRAADVLYVGTMLGAYVTRDGGATWLSLCHGIPPVPVFDMAVHPREHELVLATHGRSIWVLDVRGLLD